MQVFAFDAGGTLVATFPVSSKNAIMGARMAARMALMISFQASMGGKSRGSPSLGRPAGSKTIKVKNPAAKRNGGSLGFSEARRAKEMPWCDERRARAEMGKSLMLQIAISKVGIIKMF